MRNVTITLDDETARWARIEAARSGSSVSRLVGEMLRDHMLHEGKYRRAYRSYMGRSATMINAEGGKYPSKDEIHSR